MGCCIPATCFMALGCKILLYFMAVLFVCYGVGWIYVLWGTYGVLVPCPIMLVAFTCGYKVAPFQKVGALLCEQSMFHKPIAKFRGRLFCPWCKGPKGVELFEKGVLVKADNIMRAEGFVMRVLNVDDRHDLY